MRSTNIEQKTAKKHEKSVFLSKIALDMLAIIEIITRKQVDYVQMYFLFTLK